MNRLIIFAVGIVLVVLLIFLLFIAQRSAGKDSRDSGVGSFHQHDSGGYSSHGSYGK